MTHSCTKQSESPHADWNENRSKCIVQWWSNSISIQRIRIVLDRYCLDNVQSVFVLQNELMMSICFSGKCLLDRFHSASINSGPDAFDADWIRSVDVCCMHDVNSNPNEKVTAFYPKASLRWSRDSWRSQANHLNYADWNQHCTKIHRAVWIEFSHHQSHQDRMWSVLFGKHSDGIRVAKRIDDVNFFWMRMHFWTHFIKHQFVLVRMRLTLIAFDPYGRMLRPWCWFISELGANELVPSKCLYQVKKPYACVCVDAGSCILRCVLWSSCPPLVVLHLSIFVSAGIDDVWVILVRDAHAQKGCPNVLQKCYFEFSKSVEMYWKRVGTYRQGGCKQWDGPELKSQRFSQKQV